MRQMRLTTPLRLVSSTCGEDLIAYLGADWQRWPKAFLDRIVLPDLRGAGGWRGDCHSRPRDLGFCQDRRSLVAQWRGTSDTAEHRRHCRHDDWSKTFWTGLIDRPIVASCVDNRENKAPSLGVTMRREPTTKWLLLTGCSSRTPGRRLELDVA